MPVAGPPPVDTGTRSGPLAGVRIVSVEQFGAGPFGTLLLADLGAEVIKLEDPAAGGDVGRYVPPAQQGTDSLYFEAFNRGKRSLLLDLRTSAGREVLHRLVRTSEAVYNNLRPDRAAELGVTYRSLAPINAAIVCVSLSAYGRAGPRAGLPGYDALIQAEAGWAALTGDPEGPPTKSGLSLVDYVAGLLSALGLVAALLDARATGRGRDVEANLYDGALAMLSYQATWMLSRGIGATRQGRRIRASSHSSSSARPTAMWRSRVRRSDSFPPLRMRSGFRISRRTGASPTSPAGCGTATSW